jgi:hypothetical protein
MIVIRKSLQNVCHTAVGCHELRVMVMSWVRSNESPISVTKRGIEKLKFSFERGLNFVQQLVILNFARQKKN